MFVFNFILVSAVISFLQKPTTLSAFTVVYVCVCLCRYGMMWPGVEPEKGQYNQTYIDASKDLINQ